MDKIDGKRDCIVVGGCKNAYDRVKALDGIKLVLVATQNEIQMISERADPKVTVLSSMHSDPNLEDIEFVVSTPNNYLRWLKQSKGSLLSSPSVVVVEDFDVVDAFGYLAVLTEIKTVTGAKFLVFSGSAERDSLASLLNDPLVVTEHKAKDKRVVRVSGEREKYLILYAIMQTGLMKGSKAIYVDGEKEAYKVHLFLKAFSVQSAVEGTEDARQKSVVIFYRAAPAKFKNLIDFTGTVPVEAVGRVVYLADDCVSERLAHSAGITALSFDIERAKSFEYRVNDVLSRLSKSVLEKRKQLCFGKLKHLRSFPNYLV